MYMHSIFQMHLHCLEGHLERVRGCGFEGLSVLEWSRISHTVSHPVQGTSTVVGHTTPLLSHVQVCISSECRSCLLAISKTQLSLWLTRATCVMVMETEGKTVTQLAQLWSACRLYFSSVA